MNLFELFVKIGVDDQASDKFGAIGDKIKSGLGKAAKTAAAAIAAATAAVGALVKKSTEAYASYEQLVGGVDTLFGTASQKVQEYAANAYQTAGLSANKYMETVTGFSASLINSMTSNTQKATTVSYNQVSKTLDAQYDRAKESYDKQYNAAKSAMDREIDEYQKATEKKIKLVNQEYEERLKLIDEEEYKRTKKLDKQIEALNKEEEEQQAARKKQQQEDKKSDLQSKIDHAKSYADKRQAEKDYNDYIAEIQADAQSESRKKRIEDLQNQKQEVRDAADKKREAVQSAQSAEIAQIKEAEQKKVEEMQAARDRDLEALKSSNNAKLKSLKAYYDQQKAIAKQAEAETASAGAATNEQLAAAAEKANLAVTDMSDNANKMGTDITMIQNAYQGFAKQNYTMLDNLKLGYGGTKEEMERLLEDASKLTGQKYDISNFGDIVDAIHAIQTEMGITGTTQREAATTIEGSVNSAKAAWENLLTGMADDQQNFGDLVNKFVDSVVTAAGNILPRVQQALEGVGTLIEKLAPILAEQLPNMIATVLPALGNAALGIVQALVDGITASLPTLLPAVVEVITTLANGLIEMAPQILQMGLDIIIQLANGISQALPELIPTVVSVVLQMVETLTNPDTLNHLLDAALQIIIALGVGIINALPSFIEVAPKIIFNLVNALLLQLPKLLQMGVKLIVQLVAGVIQAIPKLIGAAPTLISQFIDAIIENFGLLAQIGIDIISEIGSGIMDAVNGAAEWGADLVDNFVSGVENAFGSVRDTFTHMGQEIRDLIGFSEPKKGPLSRFHTFAPDMMALFAKGIRENESLVLGQIKKSFDFGEQTISAGYNAKGSGAGGVGGAGNVNVTLGIDPNASLNALARALLPVLKIVAKEVG